MTSSFILNTYLLQRKEFIMRTIKKLSMTLLTLVMLVVCFSASTLTAHAAACSCGCTNYSDGLFQSGSLMFHACKNCGHTHSAGGSYEGGSGDTDGGDSDGNDVENSSNPIYCAHCGYYLGNKPAFKGPYYCVRFGYTDCRHTHSYGAPSWGGSH